MDRLAEMIRALARAEVERVLRLQMQPRLANAVSFDPKTHTAKVEIQPEGVQTNWIGFGSPWVGNGYGIVAPPDTTQANREQIKVSFPEYGSNEGIVVARVFDKRNPPPTAAKNAKIGEWYQIAKFGSSFTITHDSNNNESMAHSAQTTYSADGPTINIGTNGNNTTIVIGGGHTTTFNLIVKSGSKVTVSSGGTTQAVKLADGSNSQNLFAQ